MEIVSRLLLILVLDTLCVITVGHAAPLSDTKDAWNRNVFAPVVKTACSSDGQCWEWLPISESYDETLIIPEKNNDMTRLQYRRQIANPTSEFVSKSLKKSALDEAGRELRTALLSKQISGRTAKKDVSRSNWTPFSVLYIPHGPRTNHAVTAMSMSQRQESGMTTESPILFIEHPNSRIAPRNGQPTVQPRRQYWTIPHLLTSYGWRAFGK